MLKSQVPVLLCSLGLISHPVAENRTLPAATVAHVRTVFASALLSSDLQVRSFVTHYVKENDEALARVKQRSKRPFTIIDSILKKYDLPTELRYLAVIESELKSTATSRVGAKGPWQLMAQTARDLGLKVNGRTDERTSFCKSTKAAALYLRDLHREFKDWLLVLAAYNAGPVPVHRAMHRSHSTDFWVLQRYLPKESRQHVRRFLATAWYFDSGISNPTLAQREIATL